MPPLRIFTASLASETNTFAPIPADRSSFEDTFYAAPGKHPATPTLCSAPITVLRRVAADMGPDALVVIEGTASFAEPAGVINQGAYEGLRDEILQQLTAALPLDAVVLGLHGAMVAQGYDDVEGDIASRVRGIVGTNVVVAATFDPHSHMTQLRFDSLDLLTAFKEFSHVDFVERAEEIVDMTLRTVRGEIRPTKAKFDCLMIEVLPTSQQPTRDFVDKLYKLEHKSNLSTMSLIDKRTYTPGPDPAVLSISCIHGFMAADVPEMGTQMVVITDNDMEKAELMAQELGMELFSYRGQTRPPYFTIDQGLDRALAWTSNTANTPTDSHGNGATPAAKRMRQTAGPVVLADVWDNPGGGTAGDATHILRRCIERGVGGVAFSTMWDPMAVRLCHAAGVGAKLQLRFCGKTSPEPMSGAPVDAMVTVLAVEKAATQMWCSAVVPLGDSATVELITANQGKGGGGTIKVCLQPHFLYYAVVSHRNGVKY